MSRPRPRRFGERLPSILFAAVALSCATSLRAAAVFWNIDASGPWTTPANWSPTTLLPASADDVTINQPDPITVTLSSGSQSIHSLVDNNTLTLTAGTLAIASTAQINGTLNLNGGTLQNATLSTGLSGAVTIASGTFSNVTLASALTLNSVPLNSTNNLTFSNANLTLNSSSYYAFLYLSADETFAGTGSITFDGNYSSGGSISNFIGSPALTIASGITIKTGTGGGTFSVPTLINQGTISAQSNGTIIGINDTTFTNSGTLKALNGGTLTINSTNWSSNGTIALDATSTVNLGGTFTTVGLGNISRTGGTINLTGTLDNTNATLFLNSTTGSIVLNGGTIKNGAFSTANSAQLLVSSGTLSNVTMASDISFTAVPLNISNNLTFASSNLTLNSTTYYANLYVNSTQTFSGSGSIIFNGGYSSGGTISNFAGTPTLTIAAGVTIKTGTGGGTISVPTLINHGIISAQTAGTIIALNDNSLTNSGTLQALNGATLTINGTAWSNTGNITLDGSSTVNLGGNFTTAGIGTISRTGGTVNIIGTLDNTGANLLLNAATGSFVLDGGTIKNGTVSSANGSQLLVSSGTLSNVTLATDVTLNAVGLTMTNNLVLNGNLTLNSNGYYAFLYVNSNQSLTGNGSIIFNGNYSSGGSIYNFIGSPVLTVGPGISIKTGNGGGTIGVTTLINQGTVSAQTANTTLSINDTTFTNAGTLQASSGATLNVAFTPTNFSAGTLTGGTWNVSATSAIILPVMITTNAANITLDGPGSNIYTTAAQTTGSLSILATNAGSLTISGGRSFFGNSTFTNSGTLVVGVTSAFSAANLTLNGGTLAGAGTVSATIIPGASPHTIAPGLPGNSAAATLSLSALTTNAKTTLAFDLATPASSDRLIVSNANGLTLNGGVIQITSTTSNPYSLGYFKIIQYTGSFTGSLNTLVLSSSSPSLHYILDATHDPGFIDLRFSIPGDANDDGSVDLTDLSTILNNFGATTPNWTSGNFDGAQTIDLTDLSYVLNNFGQTFVSATDSFGRSASGNPVVAPEPASLATLVISVACMKNRRSKRAK